LTSGVSPATIGVEFRNQAAELEIELPSSLFKQFFAHRRFRVILKDIMQELAQ